MDGPELEDEERRIMREQAEQIAKDPKEQELSRQILEEWEDVVAPWPDEREEVQKRDER